MARVCPQGHRVKDNKALKCPMCGEDQPPVPKRPLWVYIAAILTALFVCVIVFSTQSKSKSTTTTATTAPQKPESEERIMYFCGIDRCESSGEYGKLIFPTGINVWSNPDPNRGAVHHKANHRDRVVVVSTRRVNNNVGGLWYELKGGGWSSDMWLTDEPCSIESFVSLGKC